MKQDIMVDIMESIVPILVFLSFIVFLFLMTHSLCDFLYDLNNSVKNIEETIDLLKQENEELKRKYNEKLL